MCSIKESLETLTEAANLLQKTFPEYRKNLCKIWFLWLSYVKARRLSSSTLNLKENAQFVEKVTFEPLMYFKQNHY